MLNKNNPVVQVDGGISIHSFNDDDFNEWVRVDFSIWQRSPEFSARKLSSLRKIFPEGLFCAYVKGRIAGSFSTMIRFYDLEHPIPTWEEVSNAGRITDHDPAGNALYGVSLGVAVEYRGMGIGARLVERARQFVVERNLDFLALGARIPFFHLYPRMTVQEYLDAQDPQGHRLDPEIRFYERCGLSVEKILTDYMSGNFADPESKNYGVLMYWKNPGTSN